MEKLSFGQWLSRQRKSLGMTQKQLADCVNCATITIRKIEAEQRRPSLQVIERLAKTFNVPRDEHEAFFEYARGYISPSHKFETHLAPWHLDSGTLSADMLSSLLAHIEHEHAFSEINRIFLDENVHLLNQAEVSGQKRGSALIEITHGLDMASQTSQYYLLLLPIEVPAEIPQVPNPELDLRNGAVRVLSRK